MSRRLRKNAALQLWIAVALLFGACRGTATYSKVEFEGAALLGVRSQPGWENSSAPLMRFDAAVRPLSWPVGVKASADLSGFFEDDTGPQSLGLGIGLTRTIELVPERLAGSLGVGRLFLSTDNGYIFASETDDWQATYLEAGLYCLVAPASDLSLGLEARYSFGDGPELGTTQLDGNFLDLYLVMKIGWPGRALAP